MLIYAYIFIGSFFLAMLLEDDVSTTAEETIAHLFLQGAQLRKLMAHLCNKCSLHVADPISDTVVMMLTCPIHLVITEVGIALFKDRPTALFPYSEMDADQRYFIEQVVQSCLLHCNRTTQMPPPKQDSLPYYHLYHHAVVQMGGGCILYTRGKKRQSAALESGTKRKRHPQNKKSLEDTSKDVACISVSRSAILEAMCDCIFASQDYGDVGVLKSVCSIILQRIACMALVDQHEQREVHAYLEELSSRISAPPQSVTG
jgi:hypothetical protein